MSIDQRPILAFDVETIPNAGLLRRLSPESKDNDYVLIESAKQDVLEKSDGKSDFLPVALHQVVVLSIVFRRGNSLSISSKAYPEFSEEKIVAAFFELVGNSNPTLVSWNGSGFDLPLLNLRALHYNISATDFWHGPGDKWEQYTSRFHNAHHDVMDILALRNGRSNSKLETVALDNDLPGKMGYGGDQVYDMYLNEHYQKIKEYCEFDAVTTYLLWLRLQHLQGNIDHNSYLAECEMMEETLINSNEEHLKKYQDTWQQLRQESKNK